MNGYYCLLARSRKTNQIYSIPLCQDDYLGNGNYMESRFLPLAGIDIFTMHFGNEEQLSNYLKKSNLVPEGENIDIFIGYRYRYKNEEKLKMHEVIYGVKNGRCDDLTHIAEGKIKGRDVVEEKNHILDKFVSKLCSDRTYLAVIRDAGSCYGMDQQTIETFTKAVDSKTSPYQIKHKNPKLCSQYGLFRGIILSLNSYDKIKVADRSSYTVAHNKYFGDKLKARNVLKSKIMYYCDHDVDIYQSGMFGNPFGDEVYMAERKRIPLNYSWEEDAKKEEAKKEELRNMLKPLPRTENRPLYVRSILLNLDKHTFVQGDNGRYTFNLANLEHEVNRDELKVLTGSITGTLARALFFHSLYLDTKNREVSLLGYVPFDTMDSVNAYQNDIDKLLKDEKRLEKAYTWCKTYEKVMGRGQKSGERGSNTI